jgi:hypothetical protein
LRRLGFDRAGLQVPSSDLCATLGGRAHTGGGLMGASAAWRSKGA